MIREKINRILFKGVGVFLLCTSCTFATYHLALEIPPIDTLIIPANQSSSSVSAIILDQNDNFYSYSTATQWISTDTSIINVRSGNAAIGEGIIFRQADSGTALLIAIDTTTIPGNIFRDTLMVRVLNNSSIRENLVPHLSPDNWSVFSANGRIMVHFPNNSAHTIKGFSLSGHCIVSRLTAESDVIFRLPRGAYIVSVNTPGGTQQLRKIIVTIER